MKKLLCSTTALLLLVSVISNAQITLSRSFRVPDSNGYTDTAKLGIANVSIQDLPGATIVPIGNLNICETGFVDLEANAETGLNYQWKRSGKVLAGETNQIYTATKKGIYQVIVTDANGRSDTSLGVQVTKLCAGVILPESVPETFDWSLDLSAGTLTVEMQLNDASSGPAIIIILNNMNQAVYSTNVHVTDGKLKEMLVPELSDGVYSIRIVVGNVTLSKSLVIKHSSAS